MHTDPTGLRDAELPATTRVYMIAGTQHGGGPGTDPSPGPCANPRNPHSASPALRALFVALEEWVSTGVAPPPSRVPTELDLPATACLILGDWSASASCGISPSPNDHLRGHAILIDEPAAVQRLSAIAAQGGIPS